MPQDIRPYRWAMDPWDMHRDGVRFAREQLDAWDSDHDTWMIPWRPWDESCDCGEGHGYRLPNKEGWMCELTYPVPMLTLDSTDRLHDLEMDVGLDGSWPSILGWPVDPYVVFYGMEQENPSLVPLWDCWPLDMNQGVELEDRIEAEFEGGNIWLLREWSGLVRDYGDLPTLKRQARKEVREAKLNPTGRLASNLRDSREALERWKRLGELTELDEYGNPDFYVEDLVPDLPQDLALIWNRLQGSHRRAERSLPDIYPEHLRTGEFNTKWC